MKFKCFFAVVAFAAAAVFAQQQRYTLTPSNGFAIITFTNKHPFGVSTLEGRLDRRWVPLENFFSTQLVGRVTLTLPPGYTQYRLRHVSIAPGNAFKNLALVYGNISTVAGVGPIPPGTNAWLPEFEGADAAGIPLSNPHSIVADLAGNIYFTEKDGHALSVIETNGIYHTVIGPLDLPLNHPPPGRREPGFFSVDPGVQAPGRYVAMQDPSGLFYRDEKIYVLDAGNSRVLRYTNGPAGPTNGLVSVLFTALDAIGVRTVITNGNGLWVSADELEAYFTDGPVLKRWRAAVGVETIPAAPPFVDLSAVTVDLQLRTVVTDRGANRVWRVNNDGIKTLEAGTGFPSGPRIGEAPFVSLAGPSSIVYLPVGGYLLGLDQGTSVWQIDAEDNAAKFVFGAPGVHAGDGEWFQKGRSDPKVSNVQSLALAPGDGDILMIEGGYIRRINFLRHKP